MMFCANRLAINRCFSGADQSLDVDLGVGSQTQNPSTPIVAVQLYGTYDESRYDES
jgi:hypothetical protein